VITWILGIYTTEKHDVVSNISRNRKIREKVIFVISILSALVHLQYCASEISSYVLVTA